MIAKNEKPQTAEPILSSHGWLYLVSCIMTTHDPTNSKERSIFERDGHVRLPDI